KGIAPAIPCVASKHKLNVAAPIPPKNISRRGRTISARFMIAEHSAPKTNPINTEIVSHEPDHAEIPQAVRNCGRTADAENHVLISRNAAVAKIPRAAQ